MLDTVARPFSVPFLLHLPTLSLESSLLEAAKSISAHRFWESVNNRAGVVGADKGAGEMLGRGKNENDSCVSHRQAPWPADGCDHIRLWERPRTLSQRGHGRSGRVQSRDWPGNRKS